MAAQVEEPALIELPYEAERDALALLTDLLLEAAAERATGQPSAASASMDESEEL